MNLDFKRGSLYTRESIGEICYPGVGRPSGGNWDTGYVRVEDNLIIFMNIGVPGRTGHDFDNKFDEQTNTITWYGKPDTHSQQGTFQKLLNKELTPHFFARWNNTNPFVYLGIGTILKYEDGFPAKQRDGIPSSCIQVTLTCDDSDQILPGMDNDETPGTNFAMEKHLEEFIITNWNEIDLGEKYDLISL